MTKVVDLASLPAPQVIEELDFEAILARQKATFQQLWDAVRVSYPELPPYDVSMLETDPAIIVLQSTSYRELMTRARVNEAARANLLKYSQGSDLVHLAADHGVTKMEGESDDALKSRIVLADQASSAAGSEEWYAYHARSASIEVADAKVYRVGSGPELELAILSSVESGVASDELLLTVRNVVTSPSVRVVNDKITVVSAVKALVGVTADIWLLPETPIEVYEGLEDGLKAALASEGGIGFDLNHSWLTAKLMRPGVARVAIMAPTADVIADDRAAIGLGNIILNYRGRQR